jgi:hypothetical protein
MATNAQPTIALPSSTGNSVVDSLLNTGASVYGTYTNAQVAKNNANKNAQTAPAIVAQQQNGTLKYILIGGGVLVSLVIVALLFRKK